MVTSLALAREFGVNNAVAVWAIEQTHHFSRTVHPEWVVDDRVVLEVSEGTAKRAREHLQRRADQKAVYAGIPEQFQDTREESYAARLFHGE